MNILLAHNPIDFDVYSAWGADLVFSGHTHGGMVRIFDNGLISPDRTLFPEYDGGVYHFEKKSTDEELIEEKKKSSYILKESNLILSRGLSRGHIGFRLFNKPELVYVEFN